MAVVTVASVTQESALTNLDFMVWWLGDALGIFLVAPPLIAWVYKGAPRYTTGELLELAAMVTIVGFGGIVSYSQWPPVFVEHRSAGLLAMLVVVWGAFRFGVRETGTLFLLIVTIYLAGLARRVGSPPHTVQGYAGYLVACVNILISGTLMLFLSTLNDARRKALADLQSANHTTASLVRLLPDVLMLQDRGARITKIFPTGRLPLLADREGKAMEELYPPDVAATRRALIEQVLRTKQLQVIELPMSTPKGERWLEMRLVPYDADHVMVLSRDITKRRETHAARAASEQRYRLISENIRDVVALFNPDGTIQYISPSVERITGYTPGELTGTKLRNITANEEYRTRARAGFERCLRGDDTAPTDEICLRKKTGAVIWVETERQGVRDEAGQIIGVLSSIRDITVRKQAQDVLRTQQELFAGIIDGTPSNIFAFNREHRFTLVNAGMTKLYGASKEDLIGKTVHDFFDQKTADAFWATNERVMSSGKSIFDEEFSIHIEGHAPRVTVTSKFPLRDPQGIITGMAGISTDITERKMLSNALEQREHELRQIMETIPNTIWTGHPNGSIEYVNENWLRYTGLTLEQARGSGWLDSVHTEDTEKVLQEWARARTEGLWYEAAFRVRSAAGEYRWFLTRARPLKDTLGNVIRWYGTNSDIHDQKESVDALQQLTVELDERVAVRTKELAYANKELESFSSAVAHDLRAPIRHALGYADMLEEALEGPEDTERRAILRRVRRAVARMQALTEDLLSLSRVSIRPIARQAVDVSAFAEAAIQSLRESSPERRVVAVVGPNLRANADPGLVALVLENLLSNAWKYSSKVALPRIEVGLGESGFFVRDNGAGFDMALSSNLFKPFSRLHTAEDFEGTGIGLATVERALHRMGGSIWVESAIGMGTTFYFSLPPSEFDEQGGGGAVEPCSIERLKFCCLPISPG